MKSTSCETTFNAKEFERTLKICEEIIKQQLLPWENLIKDTGANFKNGDIILLNKEVFKDISIPYKFKDNIFKAPYLKHAAYLMKNPPSIYPSIKYTFPKTIDKNAHLTVFNLIS